jgi:AGZA family xanthine/uracil permease-like MFS transporter
LDKKQEIIAGISTFLASMYIIAVNPAILSDVGMDYNAVLTATVLVSAVSSILMGVYARNPILVAPGMGLNAFFAYSLVQGMGVSYQVALGAVFWSGIIFVLLSIFNIRSWLVRIIPKSLRYGLAAGIGLFIALIGLKNGHFVVDNPSTLLEGASVNIVNGTFLVGLLITSVLVAKRIRAALIIGILATTLLAYPIGRLWGDAGAVLNQAVAIQLPTTDWITWPDFSLFLELELWGSLQFAFFPVILTFLLTDLFDSISTFVGIAEVGNLLDENGDPQHLKRSLIVDSLATTFAGLAGSSPGTSYIESAAGIEEGGKTGLTAVTAGLLFLPFLFFAPALQVIPSFATATALVVVGATMMRPLQSIDWKDFNSFFPPFVAMIFIPLTYSITKGIIWGFLVWSLLKLVQGKFAEIPIGLYVLDVLLIIGLLFLNL